MKLDYDELLHLLFKTQHMLMERKGFALPMTVVCEKDGQILVTYEMDPRGQCAVPFNRELPTVHLPVRLSITDRYGNIWQGCVRISFWRRIARLLKMKAERR